MAYLLDTNVFVAAKDHYYRPQVCPGFWNWLEFANDKGSVYSIVAVFKEIREGADELAKWAKGLRKRMFLDPDQAANRAHLEVREWAQHKRQYRAEALDEFMNTADSFLVAHARAHGHAVVTFEKPAPESQKRIKIPDACAALDVEWLGPFDMLEQAGARFVLAGP